MNIRATLGDLERGKKKEPVLLGLGYSSKAIKSESLKVDPR